MRIELTTSGGIAHFPGLARPVTLESDVLPAEDAARLAALVEEVHFFDLPSASPPPRGADYRRYTITVEDRGRRHTVEAFDPITPPALGRLLDFVREKTRRRT
jgi:hypothetical protein